MLRSLIGYVRGAGIDARWVVIEGDAEFFQSPSACTTACTARRRRWAAGRAERTAYERRSASNAEQLLERSGRDDIVLLHDPQTAGMVAGARRGRSPGHLARAHRARHPNDLAREAWRFLIPYVEPAAAYVFSRAELRLGGARPLKVDADPAVDRRVRAEEPDDVVHQRHGRAARRRSGGRPPASPRAVFERLDGSMGQVQREAR